MSSISDSRDIQDDAQDANRKRFLRRHKDAIKRSIEQSADKKKLKDFQKGGKVKVRPDEESVIDYHRDYNRDIILPGNDKFNVGDTIPKPTEEEEREMAQGDGEGEDDFDFYLDKDELVALYFEDMELPDLVKQQLKEEVRYVLKTGGYCKEGIPPRLAIKKTFECAIARRIANKKSGHKSPFLDDVDLRYIRKFKVPEPYTKAVMFACMDVSGSMTEYHKRLAKRFYVLLFLFLGQFYKTVDVVFVRYHSFAKEVEEEEFFYGIETGGTSVSDGLKLVSDIADERYDLQTTNMYLALASDGDIWNCDIKDTKDQMNRLLEKMQYVSYVQLSDPNFRYNVSAVDLRTVLSNMKSKKIGIASAERPQDIYPALRGLFQKKGIDND